MEIFSCIEDLKRLQKIENFFLWWGIIKDIEKVDEDGKVKAIIMEAFKLTEPLYEDSEHVMSMKWTFKNEGKIGNIFGDNMV